MKILKKYRSLRNEYHLDNPTVVGASGYDPSFSSYEKIERGFSMKRVYWVYRKGDIVIGEVLLAEGLGTNEDLLQEARDEAERAGLDMSHGTLEIYEEED